MPRHSYGLSLSSQAVRTVILMTLAYNVCLVSGSRLHWEWSCRVGGGCFEINLHNAEISLVEPVTYYDG